MGPSLLLLSSLTFFSSSASDANLAPSIKAWQEVRKTTRNVRIDFTFTQITEHGRQTFDGAFLTSTRTAGEKVGMMILTPQGQKTPSFTKLLLTSRAFYYIVSQHKIAIRLHAKNGLTLHHAFYFLEAFASPLWELLEEPSERDKFETTIESKTDSYVDLCIKEKEQRPQGCPWQNAESCIVRLVKKQTNGIPPNLPSKITISRPSIEVQIEIIKVSFGVDNKAGGLSLDPPEARDGWKVHTFEIGDE
jgi:hypothetical protein